MIEIKFRYTVERKNGHNFSKIFTIQEIEHGDVLSWTTVNLIDMNTITRDRFTGLHDKNKQEINERDICRFDDDGTVFNVEFVCENIDCGFNIMPVDAPYLEIIGRSTFFNMRIK